MLIQINTVPSVGAFIHSMLQDQWPPDKWLPVSIAPSDADLEVAVMDKSGIHALVFPVRKRGELIGWTPQRKNTSTLSLRIGVSGSRIAANKLF